MKNGRNVAYETVAACRLGGEKSNLQSVISDALKGNFGDVTSVLDDIAEQESRRVQQGQLGVQPHTPKEPRVPARAGQASLETWHARLGCTSPRVMKATSACVDGMTLTNLDWDACNCVVCMNNKPLRPQESKRARTKRDLEAPIRPFARVTMDFSIRPFARVTKDLSVSRAGRATSGC